MVEERLDIGREWTRSRQVPSAMTRKSSRCNIKLEKLENGFARGTLLIFQQGMNSEESSVVKIDACK